MKTDQIINRYFVKSCARGINSRARLSLLAIAIVIVCVAEQRAAAKPIMAPDRNSPGNERLHVYVHYDYMVAADGTSDAPDPEAIDLVRQAFDAHGIDLVIDSRHAAIPLWPMVDFGGDTGSCVPPEQTITFDTLKAQYFRPTSNHDWHYAIFGERFNCFSNTGIAWLPGDDFFIALGQYRDLLSRLPREQMLRWFAGTFMHELGHNLGLDHGGNTPVNYKPNYESVMNYSFQLNGIPYAANLGSTVPAGFRIDYSSQALAWLDENHLDETLGINGGTTDITFFNSEFGFGIGPATGAIDWNLDGTATDRDVRANLNIADDSLYTLLGGFDDWSFVRDVVSGRVKRGPRRLANENRAHEPVVDSIDPASGTSLGGSAVTIHGMHLDRVDRVLFGNVAALSFRILDVKTIIAISPPGSGTAGVTVGSGPNLSPGTSAALFTYLKPVITDISPHQGSVGTVITIHGERLGHTHLVEFRNNPGQFDPNGAAISFTVVDDNTITAVAQTSACPNDFVCSSRNGTYVAVTTDDYGSNDIVDHCCSESFFADVFDFTSHPRPIPTVTSINPASVWAATGSTTVEIRGTGFRYLDEHGFDQPNVAWVTFGGVPATNLSLWDADTVTCNVPAGASGTVDVRVWNFVGVSPVTPADRFTYAAANGLFLTQLALPRTITPADATPSLPPGNYISYSLIIINPMQTPAASVVLTDNFPVETTVLLCNSSNGACSVSGNNLTLTFPSITYGVPMTVGVLVRVNDNVPFGTIIANTATITSSTPDPDLTDNASTTSIVFPQP